MKTNMMFGLLALALLASVSFAQPADYDKYIRTGACLRSTIDTGGLMTYTYPQGLFEEYGEMSFDTFARTYYVNYEVETCPKTNGVPICPVSS